MCPCQSQAAGWDLLARKVQRITTARAVSIFRTYGIDGVVIKGLAAHLSYPDHHFRNSVDVDIAASPTEDMVALAAVSSANVDINIDLHRGLRHLDTVAWDDLFENSRLIDIDGTLIRMLRPEDHLRVLCVHWLNDGGANRERLWDVYYAVANRPADFDWDRCLNIVSATRRRWIICAIGLAHKYLDLNIDDLHFADEAKDLPRWLIKTVEKEWASDVRLMPLQMFLDDRKQLWKQVKKRIPPNPIESIIETEGSFDSRFRIHYQIIAGTKRLWPSIGKFWSIFRQRVSQ